MAWDFWRFLIQVSLQRLRKRCQANFWSAERCRTFLAYLASSFRYQLSWISWNVSKGLACKASLQKFAWHCCKSSTRSPFSSGNNMAFFGWCAFPSQAAWMSSLVKVRGLTRILSKCILSQQGFWVCFNRCVRFARCGNICIFWTPSLSPFTCSHCLQSMQSTRARKSSCLRNWGLGNVASRACWKMTRASLPCTWLAITPASMCLYEFHKCIQISSNILITDDKLQVSRTLKQALKACK